MGIRGGPPRRLRAPGAHPHDRDCDGARPSAAGPRHGEPGREIEGSMAVVILGGLATSTALNLLVLPTLALRFGRFEAAEEE